LERGGGGRGKGEGGSGKGKNGREGEGEGKGRRKEEDPQCLKCVDANAAMSNERNNSAAMTASTQSKAHH